MYIRVYIWHPRLLVEHNTQNVDKIKKIIVLNLTLEYNFVMPDCIYRFIFWYTLKIIVLCAQPKKKKKKKKKKTPCTYASLQHCCCCCRYKKIIIWTNQQVISETWIYYPKKYYFHTIIAQSYLRDQLPTYSIYAVYQLIGINNIWWELMTIELSLAIDNCYWKVVFT